MTVRWTCIALSFAATFLAAVASAVGIYRPEIYARETASWAAQGVAQDLATLFVICPALLVTLYCCARGSARAVLILLGLQLYIVYSYVLYAFFVHFNGLFLVYVAVLGFSFWSLVDALNAVNVVRLAGMFEQGRAFRYQSLYLFVSAVVFALLWLTDVVSAFAAGTAPAGLADAGLTVNPVHVLDLAFVLPAMIVTSLLLLKQNPLGLLFTAPLLTFSAAMGVAIVSMAVMMRIRGLGGTTGGIIAAFVVLTAISTHLTYGFLRRMHVGSNSEADRVGAAIVGVVK